MLVRCSCPCGTPVAIVTSAMKTVVFTVICQSKNFADVPDWVREEADIAPDAKLDCYVDEDSGVITVCEADNDFDLSDVSPVILYALRKSGCCLSALEDALMENDIIYDK